jgi:putative NADPH-quinone reductase
MSVRRILVLDGHPDPDEARLVHGLAKAYLAGAQRAGHEIRMLRLADLDWPLLRRRTDWEAPAAGAIADAQAELAWADHLVLLFPLWLGDMPAVVKGFLELVLRPDFALRTSAGEGLRGRSARVIVTMGMPPLVYRLWFGGHSMASLRRNILAFCGISPVRTTYVGPVETASATRRLAWLDKARNLGERGV